MLALSISSIGAGALGFATGRCARARKKKQKKKKKKKKKKTPRDHCHRNDE